MQCRGYDNEADTLAGADPGLFMVWGRGWHLPWGCRINGHALQIFQFEDWNLIETVTPEMLTMPPSRNYCSEETCPDWLALFLP